MTTPNLKDCAIELVGLLVAAETAAPTPELTAVHEKLRLMLYTYGGACGLSKHDIADIDNAGVTTFGGGTPKTPPDQE